MVTQFTRIFCTFSNLANNDILLMSFKRTFDICIVKINWELSSIDLTPVNYIKEKKKMLLEVYYPGFVHCVLGAFSYFNGKLE